MVQHPDAQRSSDARPALIGLDWGTSSLRAYLFGVDGAVLERRAQPWGIQHLPTGGYPEAFQTIVDGWRDQGFDLPVLAAGMVGSRTGWREVPYVACPADAGGIASGVVPFESECGLIHLVPGIMQGGSAPDVMRGEEAQIIGALESDLELSADALIVLPGTHCKWARIHDGRVIGFTTYLTGELFAMLRDHSIVGRPARGAEGSTDASRAAAFRRGLDTARASGVAGIAGKLFTTRSLFLCGDLAAADSLDYLSGLLVGEELRSVLATLGGACPPCVLVGDPALCSRYRIALGTFGVHDVRSLDETGPAGLWQIAQAARLTAASARPALERTIR